MDPCCLLGYILFAYSKYWIEWHRVHMSDGLCKCFRHAQEIYATINRMKLTKGLAQIHVRISWCAKY